jgi:hypothetical protein
MMKNLRISAVFGLIALVFCGSAADARKRKTIYKSKAIQIYGSQRLSEADFEKKFGPQIKAWLDARSRGTKKDRARARSLRKRLVAAVKQRGEFGWVRLTEAQLESKRNVKYLLLMFDVIEKKDMATRYPFRSAPTKTVEDKSGLINDWMRFYSLGWQRVRSGEVPAERGDCPAFFCPEGIQEGHSEIDALKDKFDNKMPSNEAGIAKVLEQDKDPKRRAAALYLLSYLDDGSKVAEYAARGLFDDSSTVREAATAVFSDLTVYHKDVPVPVQKVTRLIDSPYPEDRGRALALVLSLADNPDYESFIISTVADEIVKLLRVKNSANKEMAHTVLTILSGEVYPVDDYDAWENWLWKTRKERAGSAGDD